MTPLAIVQAGDDVKGAPKKPVLVDDSPSYVRKGWGEKFPITREVVADGEKRYEEDRALWLFDGPGPRETKIPGKIIHFAACGPYPVKNSKPRSGLPDVIHDRDENNLLFRFQKWSPELAEATESWIRFKQRSHFEKLDNPKLQVIVEPEPVIEWFVAVTDTVSGVTYGHGKKYVKSAGNIVEMWLNFGDAGQIRQFAQRWREGRIQFDYACLVSGSDMVIGTQRTEIAVDLSLAIERYIEHDNCPILHGKDGGQYVTQNGYDGICRSLSAQVRRQISIDGKPGNVPAVLALFQPDTFLYAEAFEPAKSIQCTDFRATFNDREDAALTAYLVARFNEKFKNEIKTHGKGKVKAIEKTDSSAKGLGISLPFLGAQISDETRKRILDQIYEDEGVKLEEGARSTDFLVSEIRVRKIKKGIDNKQLTHVQTVVVGQGQLNSYIRDSAVAQFLTADVVNASARRTLKQCGIVEGLLAKIAQTEKARKKDMEKLQDAVARLKKDTGETKRKSDPAAFKTDYEKGISNAASTFHIEGFRGWAGMIHAVYGFTHGGQSSPDAAVEGWLNGEDSPGKTRRQAIAERDAKRREAEASIAQRILAINDYFKKNAAGLGEVELLQAAIAARNAEIGRLNEELRTVLAR